MEYNIEEITKAIDILSLSTNKLTSSLNSDWNDEVMESYYRYISQCKDNIERIIAIEMKMKALCEKLDTSNVDELVIATEDVCFSIDEV